MLLLRCFRKGVVLRIMMILQENQFLRITSLGEILRSMRLTVKVTEMATISTIIN